MKKLALFFVLCLLLILGLAACESSNITALPTATGTVSLPTTVAAPVSPTVIATTSFVTATPFSTQPVTTAAPDTVAPVENLPIVETELGTLPTDCPVSQLTYKELDRGFAPGTAGPGLWAIGLQNKIQLSAGQLAQQSNKKYGWAIKVLWVVEPGQKESISLTGYNRSDYQPVWFLMSKVDTTPFFSANSSSTYYEEYPSNLFFPKAGCYDLVAKWNGGGWKLTIAVGRQ